jgi:V8-like Glu-specific endopeptidase
LRELDPTVNSEPAPSVSGDVIRPEVSLESFHRFEVPLFGEDFTVSGFPLSEMNSGAIDIAKQATLAFIRETGCPECDENRLNKNFDVPCICTGFAVTENLIVTNDHCVSNLSIGSKTTFRTFYGQDVEAELVGKTSLDGETELNERYTEIFGEVAQTDFHRGDVALLRTSDTMKLEPLKIADSSTLTPWEPLVTVGHPATMTRTGPWVTGVGSFLGADYFTRTIQSYNLPAQQGASGSAVVNLAGELVGQIAGGGYPAIAERTRVLPHKYGLYATELWVDVLETTPAPYSTYSGIPVSAPWAAPDTAAAEPAAAEPASRHTASNTHLTIARKSAIIEPLYQCPPRGVSPHHLIRESHMTRLIPQPTTCDACAAPLGRTAYDARDPLSGSWGIFCPQCFTFRGCQLGTGRGQLYRRQPEGWYQLDREASR